MLSLAKLQWETEPYPHGVATDVFEPDVYASLVANFPHAALGEFVKFGGGNKKLSLSEVNNPEAYFTIVQNNAVWAGLLQQIKSPEFQAHIMGAVREYVPTVPTTARFEFSSLPARGGCLLPHRDIPSKIVTLVIPMVRSKEWREEWGGGTDLLVPRPGFPEPVDYKAAFGVFDIAKTIPYAGNQAFVFLRSEKSWHSVGPIRGPEGKTRRTLTVNLEIA